MQICGVSFKENGKVYNFYANHVELYKGDHVVVETEKGEQIGKIVFVESREITSPLKDVLRKATSTDYDKYLKNLSDAKKALSRAREIANSLGLRMQISDSSYTFDRKQLLFNFIADERIDFRELVKQLAAEYKTRIELHQMGVRDKSKEVGGIGSCGLTLCCATFLNQIDAISINMAKNQNIALNPSKINGSCGRLLCCLSYEDDQYLECRKNMPNVGDSIKIANEHGRVIAVDILNQKYKVNINGDIKEININDCKRNK